MDIQFTRGSLYLMEQMLDRMDQDVRSQARMVPVASGEKGHSDWESLLLQLDEASAHLTGAKQAIRQANRILFDLLWSQA